MKKERRKSINLLNLIFILFIIAITVFSYLDCVKVVGQRLGEPIGLEGNIIEYKNMHFPGILLFSVGHILLVMFNQTSTRVCNLIVSILRGIINCGWIFLYEVVATYGGLYVYSYSYTVWGYMVIGISILLVIISFISLYWSVKEKKING